MQWWCYVDVVKPAQKLLRKSRSGLKFSYGPRHFWAPYMSREVWIASSVQAMKPFLRGFGCVPFIWDCIMYFSQSFECKFAGFCEWQILFLSQNSCLLWLLWLCVVNKHNSNYYFGMKVLNNTNRAIEYTTKTLWKIEQQCQTWHYFETTWLAPKSQGLHISSPKYVPDCSSYKCVFGCFLSIISLFYSFDDSLEIILSLFYKMLF